MTGRSRSNATAVSRPVRVAALGLGLALILGGCSGDDEDSAAGSTTTTSTAETTEAPAAAGELAEVRDDAAGFSIGYPSEWERLEGADPSIKLIATPNHADSMLVRVVPLGATVEGDNIAPFKSVTDEIVRSGEAIEILQEAQEFKADGLPAYSYVYKFKDGASGATGIHEHYFIFNQTRMIVIVLQALPEASYEGMKPVFDRIIASFESI